MQVSYYVAASLDGYIATSNGGIEWLAPFESTSQDYGYTNFYAAVDVVLLGRNTYEKSLSFSEWPYIEKPCWVFSHQQLKLPEADVTITDRNPSQVITELGIRGYKKAWFVGGGALAATFRDENLFDEYVISIIPVLLGSGIPLFGKSKRQENLKLVNATTYNNGLVQLHYLR